MNKKLKNSLINLGETLAMLVIALLVGALLVIISGNDPVEAYEAMLTGAFGRNPLKNQMKIYELLVKVIPLMLLAFCHVHRLQSTALEYRRRRSVRNGRDRGSGNRRLQKCFHALFSRCF